MIFEELPMAGAFIIAPERQSDDRGFFARLFCQSVFSQHRLFTGVAQINDSFAARRGTLRGMHYQLPPSSESKLVRCIRGALWDVVLDLRSDSPTFGKWFGKELTAENRLMMY